MKDNTNQLQDDKHQDDKHQEIKQILVAFTIIVLFSAIVALSLKPYYVDFYFNHQKEYSIHEAKDLILNREKLYSEVFVIKGIVKEIFPEQGFILKGINDEVIYVHNTEKLNCIPKERKTIKVAGAWNQETFWNDDFYATWIIDGCK